MTTRTVPRVLTALLSMTLLAACAGPASDGQDRLTAPTTPPAVVGEESTVADVDDDVSLAADPAPIDTVRGVDVFAFDDVIVRDDLVDTSRWQHVEFGAYSVAVPAGWDVYLAGDSPKVDDVFSKAHQDRVRVVATGGAISDLEPLIENNTDGFLIVTATRFTDFELESVTKQGLSPSRVPITTAGREPDELIVKDGMAPWLNYVRRTSTGPAGNYLEQRHVRFHDEDGHGFEISVIDDDHATVDTVIASLRSH